MAPQSDAVFSPCGKYRYTLERPLGILHHGTVLWLMLNPSTADAKTNDATIRRCIGFSRLWEFGHMLVGNLYAWRSTDPAGLWTAPDPVGPDNDVHLVRLAQRADRIVCAWGSHAQGPRVRALLELLAGRQLFCLGTTVMGAPKHPVRLASDTALVPYRYPCPKCRYQMEKPDALGCPNCHGEGLE